MVREDLQLRQFGVLLISCFFVSCLNCGVTEDRQVVKSYFKEAFRVTNIGFVITLTKICIRTDGFEKIFEIIGPILERLTKSIGVDSGGDFVVLGISGVAEGVAVDKVFLYYESCGCINAKFFSEVVFSEFTP